MIRLNCPNCGPRNLDEFRYGGEARLRPAPQSDRQRWNEYVYLRTNPKGYLKEWWYHRYGCRSWFLAERHTKSQAVKSTYRWQEGSISQPDD